MDMLSSITEGEETAFQIPPEDVKAAIKQETKAIAYKQKGWKILKQLRGIKVFSLGSRMSIVNVSY